MSAKYKVLGVDDNPTNRAILQEIFGDDFQFETAEDGPSALERVASFRPDLILLDIMMPGMSGLDVCREIRKNAELRHTKIIMVSAMVQVEERLEGFEAGADDYVVKPFDEEELRFKADVFLKLKSVQEIDQLKTDILTMLSNETCTPLNSLLVPANMLRSADPMPDATRQRLAQLLYRNATRLHAFFERLLDLSMLRSNHWTPKLSTVSLGELVSACIEAVSSNADAASVVVECTADESVSVSVDVERFRQVVLAVLDNAIRFTDSGGRVSLFVSVEGEQAVLTVADSGCGIGEEFLPKIFEEFSDFDDFSDNVVDLDQDGSTDRFGMSLAIAKYLVRALGGEISAESTLGEGTVVSIRLPLVSEPVVAGGASSSGASNA